MLLVSPISMASSAPDRCTVAACTCRVTPGTVSKKATQEYSGPRKMVFFEEDSAVIDRFELLELKDYLNQHKDLKGAKKPNISLIGYTDGCGNSEYNKELAKKRAHAVRQQVLSRFPNADIEIIVGGETTAAHTVAAMRVDIVVHTASALKTKIEKVPADAYLIDASGSMWSSWRDWSDVINASLRPDAKIYVSMMSGCKNGQNLNSIKPQAGTEIWYSYWVVLDRMKSGQTLAIISDFQSNYPLTAREAERIEAKAKNKNINIVTIQ